MQEVSSNTTSFQHPPCRQQDSIRRTQWHLQYFRPGENKFQQSSILVNTAAIRKLDSLSTCLSIWKRAGHDLRSCLEENHERPRRAYPAMLNPNPLSVLYAMSSVDERNLWKSQVQVWVACGAAKANTINHEVDDRAREWERQREREMYI